MDYEVVQNMSIEELRNVVWELDSKICRYEKELGVYYHGHYHAPPGMTTEEYESDALVNTSSLPGDVVNKINRLIQSNRAMDARVDFLLDIYNKWYDDLDQQGFIAKSKGE